MAQEIKINKFKDAPDHIKELLLRYKKMRKGDDKLNTIELHILKDYSKKKWEELSEIKFKKPEMSSYEIKKIKDEGWFGIRSMFGCSWTMFYFLLGGRGVGKSYAVLKFFIEQFLQYGRVFYWLRLTPTSASKLLANNASELIDPDIRRIYNLDITTNGHNVYLVTKRGKKDNKTGKEKIVSKVLMCKVMDLSTFYNSKGTGLYDKDLLDDPIQYYNICLDEMNREKNEKKTFDIVYAFANQLENMIRKEKDRVRIVCIGNTIAEASDLLRSMNFIPQSFGTFKLKSKRAIIEYSPLNEQAKKRLSGSAGDILSGHSSTFTNQVRLDYSLVRKDEKKKRSLCIIKFDKTEDTWFTIWNNDLVARYNNDITQKNYINMKRYIDGLYDKDVMNEVINMYDYQQFHYENISTQIMFESQLQMIKAK